MDLSWPAKKQPLLPGCWAHTLIVRSCVVQKMRSAYLSPRYTSSVASGCNMASSDEALRIY